MEPNVVLEEQKMRFLGDAQLPGQTRDFSETTAREVDLAVRALVAEAYDRAKAILTERRADLDAGAALLLQRESLTPDDFAPLRRTGAPAHG
jgi:cell division protease FtsH